MASLRRFNYPFVKDVVFTTFDQDQCKVRVCIVHRSFFL